GQQLPGERLLAVAAHVEEVNQPGDRREEQAAVAEVEKSIRFEMHHGELAVVVLDAMGSYRGGVPPFLGPLDVPRELADEGAGGVQPVVPRAVGAGLEVDLDTPL